MADKGELKPLEASMVQKQYDLSRPYLNATETAYFIHYQKSQFHADVKHRPDFPKPIKLSDHKVLWKKAELEAWLLEKMEAGNVV